MIPILVKMGASACQACLKIPLPVSVWTASQIPTVLVLWRLVSARFTHFSSYSLCFHEWLTKLAVVHCKCGVFIIYAI